MPWKVADVENKIKGLSDKQKEVWVKVANSALKRCLDGGGSQDKCESSAIRQASAVAKNVNDGGESVNIAELIAGLTSLAEAEELEEIGKTLSATSRNKIKAALDALKELLDSTDTEEADNVEAEDHRAYDAGIDTDIGAKQIATVNFVSSPRNKYGTHSSKGFKGNYAAAWRTHFSQVNGGALTPAASGPIRGTVRRTEMIAAVMKPACNLPGAESIAARAGAKSPLPGDFPQKPSDYGLSSWADPSDDDLTREDVQLSCADLAIIKRAAEAEVKRRIADREKEEAAHADECELTGDEIALIEKSVGKDGTVPLRIISPGWGSSGYYSKEVLERDGPQVFVDGLQMYWDHPTATEQTDRPERSLRDLAGVLTGAANWQEHGAAGPGLYAKGKVFEPYRKSVDELASHIGVSIRAVGSAKTGEAEGKKGPVIEKITGAKSVDFVTLPGRGGEILQLFEAARGGNQNQEVKKVSEEETKALRDENTTLKAEVARLQEALLLREAKDIAVDVLAKIDMPDMTRARLVEASAKNPPVKEGKLDEEIFKKTIEEAAKAELDYIAQVTKSGSVRGMGPGGNGGGAGLKEAFKRLHLSQGFNETEAEQMAETAARGR